MAWCGPLHADPHSADADREAVRAFLAGDTRAFDSLYERYHGYVYNICLGIAGRRDDAEDLTQETFVRVHRSLAGFRGAARFSTWLYRIAVNCAIEHVRRPGPALLADESDLDRTPSEAEQVEAAVLRATEAEQVRRALAGLCVSYRTALTLFYLQEMTVAEMAEVLQCNASTVKVRLHRARLAFRKAFLALESSDEQILSPRR